RNFRQSHAHLSGKKSAFECQRCGANWQCPIAGNRLELEIGEPSEPLTWGGSPSQGWLCEVMVCRLPGPVGPPGPTRNFQSIAFPGCYTRAVVARESIQPRRPTVITTATSW